mmetsp:Transcript_11836/g.12206  ORF Transcript_11836/g.12206 Transcript_11836/m.12206 type:complete len:138 (-) Transcript_11836:70-483(-)
MFCRSFLNFKKLKKFSLNSNKISLKLFSVISFNFYEERTGDTIKVKAEIGKKVLDIALENNVDIEGACGGELACSTCHVKLQKELFDKLPPKIVEEEDMLDLAWGVTDTSRLCCQIKVSELLEGTVFTVPKETNNML